MIETERLLLRGWREDDVEPFVRHTNMPAVMRWLGGVRDPEEIRATILDKWLRRERELGFTLWAVERRRDCELLGFCGLKIADDPGTPVEGMHEIGWRLREDAWGQGYAREAAAASLDFAFNQTDAEQVVALTVQGNLASWGLMKRLGMTRRPELDYDGPAWAEGRVIVYTIGRDQWPLPTS